MRLLNLGCGSNRPKDERWINLDQLHAVLKPGTPERINLDKETNYVNHDLLTTRLPFPDNHWDGILASHVIEHFDCHHAVRVLEECYRGLKPGGLLVVSVPDAEYFLAVADVDIPANAMELFGEPICPGEEWKGSFFNYALFHDDHKQLLTNDSLRCLLLRAGFENAEIYPEYVEDSPIHQAIEPVMNRRKFSLEMCAVKSA